MSPSELIERDAPENVGALPVMRLAMVASLVGLVAPVAQAQEPATKPLNDAMCRCRGSSVSGAGMATMPTPISASATKIVATRGQAGRSEAWNR